MADPNDDDTVDTTDQDAGGADSSDGGDAGGDAGGDTQDASGGDGSQDDDGEVVVCTITRTADGEYKLYQGDEPEEGGGDEGTEDDQGADQGAQGSGGADTGEQGQGGEGEGEQDGTVYQTVGELLKAVLDTVRADHEQVTGGAGQSDEQNMQAGYAEQGGPGAAPPAAGGAGASGGSPVAPGMTGS